MRRGNVTPHTRRGRSRGQALVEFALIAPVFFIIFFSTIEFALITASVGSFNFASRDGARLGSLLGRTDSTSDTQVLAVIKGHVLGFVMAKASEIDIYRATSNGQCLNGSGAATTVDDVACTKDQYLLGTNMVVTSSTSGWPVNARNDSLQGADYLGVRIVYRYTYLTGFIAGVGTPLNLSATSVQRIEPQDFQGAIDRPLAKGDLASAPLAVRAAGTPDALNASGTLLALLPTQRGDRW